MKEPKHVYLFENGMVMAFDEDGQQMPEFQGSLSDLSMKLLSVGWPWERIMKVKWRSYT